MFGSLVVVRGWVVGPVFGSWVTAWVSSGCGFWRGSLWWLWFFVFGLWPVLKRVVGCGWVRCLGHGWVVAEVGCGWSGSLVVDRRAGFGLVGWDRLMVGLKRWICWSVGGSVGLIIGSSDGGSGDDFFWMGLPWWVSNRWRRFLIGGFVGLMVWWRGFLIGVGLMVCVCVCVCGWGKKIRLRERVVVEGGRLIQRGFDGLCLCLWFVLEDEGDWGKKIRLESLGKWNHA